MKKLLPIIMCLPILACMPITTLTPAQPEPKTPVVSKPATPEQRALTWAVTLCTKFGYERKSAEFRLCAEQRYDQFLMENR